MMDHDQVQAWTGREDTASLEASVFRHQQRFAATPQMRNERIHDLSEVFAMPQRNRVSFCRQSVRRAKAWDGNGGSGWKASRRRVDKHTEASLCEPFVLLHLSMSRPYCQGLPPPPLHPFPVHSLSAPSQRPD